MEGKKYKASVVELHRKRLEKIVAGRDRESNKESIKKARLILKEFLPHGKLPPLIEALEDGYPEIRELAQQCLRKLTGMNFGGDVRAWRRWYRSGERTR